LRTALNYYRAVDTEFAPPKVWLPSEPPRQDYYLTGKDVANHILAIRHNPQAKRIVRVILIGLRTGTRSKALRGLHV
jgi:hypothetical protein